MIASERQFHINCETGDVGRYCLLPGDPGRCEKIARYFDNPVHVMTNREYVTYTGTLLGEKLDVTSGDIVIATGAVRMEGTSREYAPIEFPAVADFQVLTALVDAAKASGRRWHAGVVQCKDSFYGQHSPERMPVSYELQSKWEAWKRLGVLASEMESAALFTVAAHRGVRCGSAFHVIWNQERNAAGLDQTRDEDTESAIRVGIEAVKLLIQRDRVSGR